MLSLAVAIWFGTLSSANPAWHGQCAPFPQSECGNVRQIAWCESWWDPLAVSPTGDWGLMGINEVHRERVRGLGYRWGHLLDWRVNLRVAHEIWLDQGWRPWRCKGR